MFVGRINELLAKKSREERKTYTQKDLADFLGISRQSVSVMASTRGVKTLNAEIIFQMCLYFGVEPGNYNALFDLESDTEPAETLRDEDEEDEAVAVAMA
jgi:transcriptional regulator with XRE-family HTH domain